MSSNSSNQEEIGNTEAISSVSVRQPAAKFNYAFTLNNYSRTEYEQIKSFCSVSAKKWIIGQEIGEQGTHHLQCYMSLHTKQRITALKKIEGFERCHFEEAKASWQENFKYCSKDEQYECFPAYARPRIAKPIVLRIPDYPWQSDIIRMVKEPPTSDRKITWIYDEHGCGGKTTLMKYLFQQELCAFTTGGKKTDIMNLMLNHKERLQLDYWCVCFNLTKDTNPEHVSYTSMEMLIDGIVENHKFECSNFLIHTPHVIVFANILPAFHKLSIDRWDVYTIDDKSLKAWEATGSNDPRDLL